jgi:hypothetical protein
MGALGVDRLVPRLKVKKAGTLLVFPRREAAACLCAGHSDGTVANARVSGKGGRFAAACRRRTVRGQDVQRCERPGLNC